MKLITFQSGAGPAIGMVDGDEIIPLAADPALPATMVEFVALGAAGIERAAALQRTASRIPLDGSRLLAPIRPRNNIMCVGKNYHEHAREFAGSGFDASANQTVPDAPVIFTKALSAIVGPDDAVRISDDATATSDYEGELGVVIGPGGHHVAAADAPRPCLRVHHRQRRHDPRPAETTCAVLHRQERRDLLSDRAGARDG